MERLPKKELDCIRRREGGLLGRLCRELLRGGRWHGRVKGWGGLSSSAERVRRDVLRLHKLEMSNGRSGPLLKF
jgi:hypothetical protein